MKPKLQKVPVSERALVQRLNRKLKDVDPPQLLRAARGSAAIALGNYFTVDIARNLVCEKDVDLEKLGRKLCALQEWEALSK